MIPISKTVKLIAVILAVTFICACTNKVWEFKTGAKVESSPTIINGYVYAGSFDRKVYCLDAANGKKT